MSDAGRFLRRFAFGAAMAVAGTGLILAFSVVNPGQSLAADTKAKEPGNAVGAGANWQTNVNGKGAGETLTLDDKQLAVVKTINDYFNGINDLRGKFLQTDGEQQQQKGEFYIKRPGKFRFVYGAPSKLVILSDGDTLSFEDYDLKHADRYPLDSTPFRLLLAKNVNLAHDSDVKELTQTDDLVTMTVQDKANENQGQIQLFFVKNAGVLELKEWVIVGAQGDNTRVEIADLVRDKPVDANYFQNAPLEIEGAKPRQK